MKPVKTFLFVSGALVAGLVALHVMHTTNDKQQNINKIPTTSYGAFLAAQHALHTNNFDKASELLYNIDENAQQYKSVDEIRILTDFLNGVVPASIDKIREDKSLYLTIVRDAYFIQNDKWADVYDAHKDIRLFAPLRIWSGVATKRVSKTFEFIDSLETNLSWRAFLRGQVYAEQGKIKEATKEFETVRPEFMNLNDYMYVMSFYKHNNLDAQANKLKTQFTKYPGSIFMSNFTDIPDWSVFAGYKKQLSFNLIQTVSHNNSIKHSDLYLVLLSLAKNIAPDETVITDAINYYAGMYKMGKNGNYEKYMTKISESSPYYPFAKLRLADTHNSESEVRKIIEIQPWFMPAIGKLVGMQIKNNNQRTALKIIDNTLKKNDIPIDAKIFLYKMRASTNIVFQDFKPAQKDLDKVKILVSQPDMDILNLQAKIWAATKQNLDQAYSNSLQMIKIAPADNCAWDTLGMVIWAREGLDEALEIIEKVGEMAKSCSSLFEHLGDMYVEKGDTKLAKDAYIRAIELSDDGYTVKKLLEKKLKRLK